MWQFDFQWWWVCCGGEFVVVANWPWCRRLFPDTYHYLRICFPLLFFLGTTWKKRKFILSWRHWRRHFIQRWTSSTSLLPLTPLNMIICKLKFSFQTHLDLKLETYTTLKQEKTSKHDKSRSFDCKTLNYTSHYRINDKIIILSWS